MYQNNYFKKKSTKLNNLIHKIFKFVNQNDKRNIENIIINNKYNFKYKLISIYKIISKYTNNTNNTNNAKSFISNKFNSYINKINFGINNETKIIDIGGGEGDMIFNLKNIYEEKNILLNKNNLICVETRNEWVEEYKFKNKDITYHFWDSINLNLDIKNVDIVICMVSLHHMKDKTINYIINEICSFIKKDGLLFIKEHNCNNESYEFIEWEHHLYHLLDCKNKKKEIDYEHYVCNTIHNFKKANEWRKIFEQKGFTFIERTNRFLDDIFIEDEKNASNLYWDIYKYEK